MYRIAAREQFSDVTFLWDVEAPDVAKVAQPGQFVILRLHDGGERIPLTIADFDRDRGIITMVIQAIGKTTREMLRDYKAGDTFSDFVGPLGVPSHVANYGHVVVVGGGLGVAPIYPQLRALKEAGNKTTAIIGFRNKDLVFWEDRFRNYADELIVCTDDGSYGRPGFVTKALEEVCGRDVRPNLAIAIGPLPMMRACAEATRPFGVKTMVSLNAIMVDGTGMCGSCRVNVGGEIRFACVDGPDFDAHKVDFPELTLRQQRFKAQETTANEEFAHVCNLDKALFAQEKKNYKKIRELAPHATKMPERNAEERSHNFEEVNLGYTMADALVEAERCIQCKIPTCIAGCPVSIDIPRFIRHVLVRDIPAALGVIYESNLFPSICGRVCPQESQCEEQCVIGKKIEPVAIGRLERFVGDFGKPEPVKPRKGPPIGRAAIVGSGPAGLACAGDLAQAGVEVTVYEALHVIGGVLRYGIPSFRLPRQTIEREVQRLTDLGVKIETNKVIGRTFTIQDLLSTMGYDAVFVGSGAGFPVFLGIPGEFAGQVYSANEFLTRVNLMGGDRFPYEDTPVTIGKKVVVIGAGNTAMDCLRVSRRIGAGEVHCVYRRTEAEAPARVEEIRHAKEEGIHFHWLRGPKEIVTDAQGNIQAIVSQVMELGEPDASGRRSPVPVKGSLETIECDTVIYALGTRANPIIAQSTKELGTTKRGYLVADDATQATTMKGVFAGGDIVTGGATVILALGAGRKAAKGMIAYLRDRQWPPKLEEVVAEAKVGERLCTRCHRPLEGDEEYVCCAGAPLVWQCTQCQKVSEGFAFPFGLCSHCGGRLELELEHKPSLDEVAAQDAVRQAIEIELGGISFYGRGAADLADPELRKLFFRLATMEQEHLETLAHRYHVDVRALAPSSGPSTAQIAVYAAPGEDLKTGTGLGLLKLAVHLEKRAFRFFSENAGKHREGSAVWKLYRELAAEEREHVQLLETELIRYHQGKAGLI